MTTPYAVYKLTAFGRNHPLEWAILVAIFLGSMLGWIHSICYASNLRLAPEFQLSSMAMNGMRLAFAMPFIGLGIYVYVVLIPLHQGIFVELPSWMIYIHFLSLGCIAYSIWRSATQLTTLKLGRKTIFLDIYGTVFAMWFCFIGVWFIQKSVVKELST